VQVCRAVGQRDHLREGVGPLGAAQQRGVSDLRGEATGGAGAARGAQGGAEERHCGFGRHFGRVFVVGVYLRMESRGRRLFCGRQPARGGELDVAEMESRAWRLDQYIYNYM
jgi:hypothetical protein